MRQFGRGTYHSQLHQRDYGCHDFSSTYAFGMAFADLKKPKGPGVLHLSAWWIVGRQSVTQLADSCANPQLFLVYARSV